MKGFIVIGLMLAGYTFIYIGISKISTGLTVSEIVAVVP